MILTHDSLNIVSNKQEHAVHVNVVSVLLYRELIVLH